MNDQHKKSPAIQTLTVAQKDGIKSETLKWNYRNNSRNNPVNYSLKRKSSTLFSTEVYNCLNNFSHSKTLILSSQLSPYQLPSFLATIIPKMLLPNALHPSLHNPPHPSPIYLSLYLAPNIVSRFYLKSNSDWKFSDRVWYMI